MCTVHLDGRRARRIAVIIYRLYHFENFIFPVLGRLRFKSVSVGGVLFAYNSVVYSHDQGVMGCSQLRNNNRTCLELPFDVPYYVMSPKCLSKKSI